MKHFKRVISMMLVVVMCIAALPANVFAWSSMSHANSADIILMELQRMENRRRDRRAGVTIFAYGKEDTSKTPYTYLIPEEFEDAIMSYPDAFRAGSLGPDFYPDIIVGQMMTHPYDARKTMGSGEWVKLLVESVNCLPKDSAERKEALSFTLGYMLHFCGDLFGHDFINTFSGGTYPSLTDIDYTNGMGAEINNIMSHMSQETYMDSLVNKDFYKKNNYLNIKAPTKFVTDTLITKGNAENGHAAIYDKYAELPPHFEWLIDWRNELYLEANEWRDNPDPTLSAAATAYLDRWVEDLDRAIYALTETFDTIARRLVTEANPSTVDIVTEEVKKWGKTYGIYITGVPDHMIDGVKISIEVLDAIFEALDFMDIELFDLDELIEDLIEDILLEAIGFPGIDKALKQYETRLKNPEVQLDHKDNPYKPSNANFKEFKAYMDRYAAEQKLLSTTTLTNILNDKDNGVLTEVIDSDFEAFYNTMVMFKLILIGPEKFSELVNELSGKTQNAYKAKTAYVSATGLDMEITTASFVDSGTDNDIYAVVYKVVNGKKTQVAKKLLDKSGYNDFEIGAKDNYFVEIPEAVRLDQLEVSIEQKSNGTAGTFWKCENIKITPMHAGVKLIEPVSVGGNNHMDSGRNWHLNFQKALNARNAGSSKTLPVTTLKVQIRTGKSGSTPGTNSDVYLEVFNGTSNTVWESVLLDKNNYDDFESGNNDTYIVPVAKYNYSTGETEAITLDKLEFAIRNSGGDDWLVSDMWVTPYNGELQLAETAFIGDDTTLSNSSRRHNLKSLYKDSDYKKLEPTSLSYTTNLDAGLIGYVRSLDASSQWIAAENPLWEDQTIRGNVFFRLFKGFGPEIEYRGDRMLGTSQSLDATITLNGVWNGVPKERRDKVSGAQKVNIVNGYVKLSFINSAGQVVCSTEKINVSADNIATVKDFTNAKLVPGTYDVKVNFIPAVDRGSLHSVSEKVFPKALVITGANGNVPGESQSGSTSDNLTVIDRIQINIKSPKAGEKPSLEATPVTSGIEITNVEWYYPASIETFEAGNDYGVKISFAPKAGYKLAGDFATNGTMLVNAQNAEFSTRSTRTGVQYYTLYTFKLPKAAEEIQSEQQTQVTPPDEKTYSIIPVGEKVITTTHPDEKIEFKATVDYVGELPVDYQWYRCDKDGKETGSPVSMTDTLKIDGIPESEASEPRYYMCKTVIGGNIKSLMFSCILAYAGDNNENKELPFADVKEADWYFASVKGAYQMGLINGKGADSYAPQDNMTYAEAVKLAACMNILYNGGDPNTAIASGKDVWYSTYMKYALENGIIDDDLTPKANEKITRKEYVYIFSKALPKDAFGEKNYIPTGAIPDIKEEKFAQDKAIYLFYRAGILAGNDSRGTFNPAGNITRAEVAAILIRMMDSTARVDAPKDLGL